MDDDDIIRDEEVGSHPFNKLTRLGHEVLEATINHPDYDGERIYVIVAKAVGGFTVEYGMAVHQPDAKGGEPIDYGQAVQDIAINVQQLARRAPGIDVIRIRRSKDWGEE